MYWLLNNNWKLRIRSINECSGTWSYLRRISRKEAFMKFRTFFSEEMWNWKGTPENRICMTLVNRKRVFGRLHLRGVGMIYEMEKNKNMCKPAWCTRSHKRTVRLGNQLYFFDFISFFMDGRGGKESHTNTHKIMPNCSTQMRQKIFDIKYFFYLFIVSYNLKRLFFWWFFWFPWSLFQRVMICW